MNTDALFLRACRREPVGRTPIWFMRQAGRYMPEYRAIRANHSFLEMVKTPEIAAQITLQPIAALPVDAAIIYSDILPPLEGMGLHLTYEQGEGPVIHNPVRSHADVLSLREADARETMGFTLEAIRLVQRELGGRIPLIGFSGAPFTLASYAIEGAGSREYRRTKLLMYRDPATWHLLMEKLSALVADYLIAQIEAGADAVQIFDSWAGALSPGDYAEYVLPYVRGVVARVREWTAELQNRGTAEPWNQEPTIRVHDETATRRAASHQPPAIAHRPLSIPIIYFGTTMGGMGRLLRETGADVIGLDWRVSFDEGWERLGHDVAVQGNLDPAVLFAPVEEIERRAADILRRAGGRPGHIFNLGHGILTETPVDNVRRLAEFVREHSQNPELRTQNHS